MKQFSLSLLLLLDYVWSLLFSKQKLYGVVRDTGESQIPGVWDTGKSLIAGVHTHVIRGFYSYFQIPGVWDTGNCKLPVSGTPGITIPGVPDTC